MEAVGVTPRPEHPGFTACQFNGMFAAAEESTLNRPTTGVVFFSWNSRMRSSRSSTKVWMQGTVLFVMDAPRVVVGVDLEWHQTQSIEAGRLTIIMSLVVRMVGHATLVPALTPRYGTPSARTFEWPRSSPVRAAA